MALVIRARQQRHQRAQQRHIATYRLRSTFHQGAIPSTSQRFSFDQPPEEADNETSTLFLFELNQHGARRATCESTTSSSFVVLIHADIQRWNCVLHSNHAGRATTSNASHPCESEDHGRLGVV